MYVFISEIYTISKITTLIGGAEMKLDSIGKNIRAYRQAKKLRQEDLAEKTGLSANCVSMVERGEKIPSLETFICIANALGVSIIIESICTIWHMPL